MSSAMPTARTADRDAGENRELQFAAIEIGGANFVEDLHNGLPRLLLGYKYKESNTRQGQSLAADDRSANRRY